MQNRCIINGDGEMHHDKDIKQIVNVITDTIKKYMREYRLGIWNSPIPLILSFLPKNVDFWL
jgi:hypothetical protein